MKILHRVFLIHLLILFLFQFISPGGYSQIKNAEPEKKYNSLKFKLSLAGSGLFYAGTLTGLSTIWYKDQERAGFHLFNDNSGWLQVDKFGHAFTTYMMGKAGIEVMKWTGIKRKKAIIFGGSFGFLFMTSVEFLDGQYVAWGASPGDIGANAFGSLLLIGQELAFGKQLVSMKFSYHPTALAKYRPDHLGERDIERIIKDYNGHTYWFSLNWRSVFKGHTIIPEWLCISGGYGGYGMLGGDANPRYYRGQLLPVTERYRRYFFSFDIDLDKVHTRSKFLKRTFFLLNLLKFPLPALEYNELGAWKFHPVYF